MLSITITVMMAVCIAILVIVTCFTQRHLNQIEDALDDVDEYIRNVNGAATSQAVFTVKKIDEFDTELHKQITGYYDTMEPVFDLLEYIIKDIERLDNMTTQDHRDLVDIRSRYILYREPAQEDQTDGND